MKKGVRCEGEGDAADCSIVVGHDLLLTVGGWNDTSSVVREMFSGPLNCLFSDIFSLKSLFIN